MNRNRNIQDLVADASQRNEEFEFKQMQIISSNNLDQGKPVSDAAVTGTRDSSKKAFFQEFEKVVQASDVILMVLDARDPVGCRSRKIEEMILQYGKKRLILVLNKIDLVPRENAEAWIKYLKNEFPTIAFKASTQHQSTRLGQANNVNLQTASDKVLKMSGCVGADELMNILKNYARNSDIKTAITVGVIGYPNTGKSSLINSLKRHKVCSVGSTPGQTRHTQEIFLDKHIKLLDCPGIVFSQGESSSAGEEVLRNCIKVELLDDPISPVEAILGKCKHDRLCKIYDIPVFRNCQEFLLLCARKMGRLRKGGVADLEGAAKTIINDWNSGKIPFYSVPPKSTAIISSEIVQTWAKEFNLDDIMSMD